ncbi:hypothetical protein GGI11_003262 [Coemansia sp. RSA 2049]|nr:hypothetical protein GGI11_003262 [Coemansia sp. RSA 2049]
MGPDYGAVATTDSGTMWTLVRISSQLQVVASSDELQRLALALDIDIVNLDHETDFLPTEEYIVQIICRLIWTINTVCVC